MRTLNFMHVHLECTQSFNHFQAKERDACASLLLVFKELHIHYFSHPYNNFVRYVSDIIPILQELNLNIKLPG